MTRPWLWLGVVLVLAGALRVYRLGEVPYGLHMDEASIVYNAWSVSLWHRDEGAHFMPLSFQSFGDYKPPLLIYFLAILYKIFGLQVMAIRFISALSGIASVGLLYLIGLKIFKSPWLSLMAAAVMAVSSWSVTSSRIGYEQSLTLFWVCLGILGLLNIKRGWWWLVSSLSFGLSLYTFHTAKVFVPLYILMYLWYFRKTLRRSRRTVILFVAVITVLSLPMLIDTFLGQGGARGATVIFFRADWPKLLGDNVLAYVSPLFWIGGVDGVSLRHVVPGFGILYWVECLCLMVGLLVSHKSWIRWWFLIGLVPGLLTAGSPHALRTLLAVIPEALLAVTGFYWIFLKLGRYRGAYIGLVVILWTLNVGFYLREYYGAYAIASAPAFSYGYEQAIKSIDAYKNSVDSIHITDAYGHPYIYVLLYERITPQDYGWGALNDYHFGPLTWPETVPNSLYIGLPSEIPPTDPKVVTVITIPGTQVPAMVVAKT